MSRKGAWWLLLVTVLWTVLPASACLLSGRAQRQHACCHAMADDCPMHSMAASNSCCQWHGETAVIAPEIALPSTHGHAAVFPLHRSRLFTRDASRITSQLAQEAPPPDPSPGGLSVLRI